MKECPFCKKSFPNVYAFKRHLCQPFFESNSFQTTTAIYNHPYFATCQKFPKPIMLKRNNTPPKGSDDGCG